MMGTDARTFMERRVPLAELGQEIDGAMTSREALEAANLHDWNLRKMQTGALVPTSNGVMESQSFVSVPGKYAIVRDVPHAHPLSPKRKAIGVVGERYQLVQNEDAFAFLDNLLDVAGERIPFEYAGAIRDDAKVFIGLRLPRTITVGDDDQIDMRLLCTNTHDGTSPFTVSLHINRLMCTNAIELTKRNAKRAQQHWQLRHTSSIEGRIAAARETLQLSFAAVDAFEREAQELIAKTISDRQFERIVEGVFPIDRDASRRAIDATQATRLEVRSIYRDSDTQRNIHGTAWGALNAFVEWTDWVRDVRSKTQTPAQARAYAQLDSRHVARFKADVMDRVLALR
jgi:phage/plasmid-like protein (TIGR03299 family)